MVGLADVEKTLRIGPMYNSLDRIPARDKQTDGRTDGRSDILRRHGPRYAYASRGKTRGQSNLTKSASRGANSPVRGHPRGSKFVPLNSWGRGSY